MSLIQKIKTAQLTARKNRDAVSASALTTLIGEVEMFGKSNGNRQTTDEEAVAIVKKFIKNVDESLTVLSQTDPRYATLQQERAVFESFLPKQLSRQELDEVVDEIVASIKHQGSAVNIGVVMTQLKQRYAGMYDGKSATESIKRAIAQ